MKIWIHEEDSNTHKIIKLNCEMHSMYTYLGDFSDEELKVFFLKLQDNVDFKKNTQLLKYYGYLHLLIKKTK